MLIDREYEQEFLTSIIGLVKKIFPDLIIDYILDVGSRAKGEITSLSDYDFQITARSNERILFSSRDINSDILAVKQYMIDPQVASIYGLHFYEPDLKDVHWIENELMKKFRRKTGLVFVDTRSCILNLAFETVFSAFRTHWFTLTSNIVVDTLGIHPALQNILIAQPCFHWQQTIDLQVDRFMKHKKLNLLMQEFQNPDQPALNSGFQGIWRKWNRWCLNYLRFAIGTWSLAENRYYTYRRSDVLRFVSSHLPPHCFKFALELYRDKDEVPLRVKKADPSNERIFLIDFLTQQYGELETFLKTVYLRLRESRPPREEERFEENAKRILQLFSEFCPVPALDHNSWSIQSRINGQEFLGLSSYPGE